MQGEFEKIMEHVIDHGAMVPRPASIEDIDLCNEDLLEFDFHALPEEYEDFLSMLNGFAWNGIEFFGTDLVTDTETNYTLIDIVTFNEEMEEYYDTDCYLLIGRSDEDVYVYNTGNEKYEVLDRCGKDVMEEHDHFLAFFIHVVGCRINPDEQ